MLGRQNIKFLLYWKGSACMCVRLALQLGNFLLTFRNNVSVPSSRVAVRNDPEERNSFVR
jgi:hypothetical protein